MKSPVGLRENKLRNRDAVLHALTSRFFCRVSVIFDVQMRLILGSSGTKYAFIPLQRSSTTILEVSPDIVESAARDCFFGPPPKPEAGNPDPRHWMKQAMEEVRKNCPGRRQTWPAEQPATTGVSGIPGVCPSTWIQWEGNCYNVTGQALTYTQAREECVQIGGMMVVPQSDSETQFLLQFIPGAAGVPGSGIWIDCNDMQIEGQWECKEGETEVTLTEMPWYYGEPSDGGEDCASLSIWRDASGKWNDIPCDLDRYTVCKQPLHVVN